MEPNDSDKSGQATSNSTNKPQYSKLPKDSPVSVSPATTNAASGRLVYVRRRVEVDSSKDTNKPSKDILVSSSSTPVPSPSPSPAAESSLQGPTTTIHRLDWEERYHRLQMLLNKLNESDQTDHLQMLWSLSSAELSNHAVELEKRSIQFSLEEAREMQRVAALNVLGRSVNSLQSTSNDGE